MNIIIKAAEFAKHAHEGQTRKYTCRPYIEHPMRVAGRTTILEDVPEEVVAAAWLHDVIEDCAPECKNAMRFLYPHSVISLVMELTNPSKSRPNLKRVQRKALDREHIAQASRWAKAIKALDRIDNLHELPDNDFLPVYTAESSLLANALETPGDLVIGPLVDELRNLIAALERRAA